MRIRVLVLVLLCLLATMAAYARLPLSLRAGGAQPVVPPTGPQLLHVSTDNPRYFATPDGAPVYLTGSHHWNNLQDQGPTDPPVGIDYTAYITWMQANNFNFMRMWDINDSPFGAPGAGIEGFFVPLPFLRNGGGTAADGKPKFTLPTSRLGNYNQAYFDRMRANIIAAGAKNIYVSVMLFEGWSFKVNGLWTYNPYKSNNNANSPVINGDPGNTGNGTTSLTASAPAAVVTVQNAYAEKVIDTVHDLPNVLYEIANETAGDFTWQSNLVNHIKTYEQNTYGVRHPVGITTTDNANGNAAILSTPADWISPTPGLSDPYNYKDNPPPNDGTKVVLSDTDHLFGIGGSAVWVWQTFTRGNDAILMDDLGNTGIFLGGRTGTEDENNPSWHSARTGMTQTAAYAARMNLKTARPSTTLSSTGYMLATAGTQYLAFAPSGGSFTVDLSAGAGQNFSVEWYNVNTSAMQTAGTVAGGSSSTGFNSPFGGAPAALFLNVTGGTPPPTASLTANPTAITVGGSSTLTWSSTNATSCTGTGFSTGNATSGSQSVSPIVTSGYSVSCTGAGGTAGASATVTVSSGSAGGNCVTGATADGCVIFIGSSKTLVANGGSGPTVSLATDPGSQYVNGSYALVLFNGVCCTNGGFMDGGGAGDAIMLANGGQIYVRGWEKTWYLVTQTTHVGIGVTRSPSFVTVNDPSWLTLNSGAAATALSIGAPVDNLYAANTLTITADQLPANGTVTLADGVTAVASGQVLTSAQLTGLKFIPSAVGRKYQRDDSFSYVVTDPAGVGAVGYAGLSVRPSLLWADPPLTQIGGTSCTTAQPPGGPCQYAPTVPQPSATGDLVGFILQNNTASPVSGSLHFGQVFMPGTLATTDNLCATATGGSQCAVYVQKDVKVQNNDGSVRHAVLALNSPSIGANSSLGFLLLKCGGGGQPACPAAPSAAADNVALAAGAYNVTATLSNGASGSPQCKTILQASNANTGPLVPTSTQTWLNGPVVKAYTAIGTTNSGGLRVQCDIYSYSDGTIVTDLIIGNDWGVGNLVSGKHDVVYDISVSDGFSQAAVRNYLYSKFPHTVTSGAHITPNVQYDVPYLMATGATPTYDMTTGIDPGWNEQQFNCGDAVALTGCWKLLSAVPGTNCSSGPCGTGNYDMGWADTGPRPDIAPLNGWTTPWLVGQSPLMRNIMVANAKEGATVPFHWTDDRTGYQVCGDASLCGGNFVTNLRANGGTPLPLGDPCTPFNKIACGNGNPWDFIGEVEVSHTPDLGYMAYLTTGNHFLMELFASAVDYAILSSPNLYNNSFDVSGNYTAGFMGEFQWGGCTGGSGQPCSDISESRHQAWILRSAGYGVYLLPDTHFLKPYITKQVKNSMMARLNAAIAQREDSSYVIQEGLSDNYMNASSNAPSIPPWNGDYVVATSGFLAGLQIPSASPAARRWSKHKANYQGGLILWGRLGLPSFNGTTLGYSVLCSGVDCSGGNASVASPTTTPMPTASVMRAHNFGQGSGSQPGFWPNTFGVPQGNCAFGGLDSALGSECAIRVAALASNLTRNFAPFDVAAWAQAMGMFYEAQGVSGANIIQSYQARNQWQIAPVLPDGSVLDMAHHKKQTSGSATLACSTPTCFLFAVSETGSTFNLSSPNASGVDIMLTLADGGSEQQGAGSPGAGGGGGGTGTMSASPNGADWYGLGGCGATTFNGGAGNDVVGIGVTCFGPLAAQTVRYRTTTPGSKTKQIGLATNYAGNLATFRPGLDTLNFASNLNGSGVTSGNVMNMCNTSPAGDAVFTIAGGSGSMTLTLKSVACNAANLATSITVN